MYILKNEDLRTENNSNIGTKLHIWLMVYVSLKSILVWWSCWCSASLTQVHFIRILFKWGHENACLSMHYHSTVGLRCVTVCWCELCFSSCFSSWLQVSSPLVISSDLTLIRTHAHKSTHTHTGWNKRWRLLRDESEQTVYLFKMQIWTNCTHPWFSSACSGQCFPLLLFWKWGILAFVYIHGPIDLGTVIRWRIVWMYVNKNV